MGSPSEEHPGIGALCGEQSDTGDLCLGLTGKDVLCLKEA